MADKSSIVAIADRLRIMMAGLYQEESRKVRPTYTTKVWGLDGYAIDGLTIAIDLEYTDEAHPDPISVFIMSWGDDPEVCIIEFGKDDPFDGVLSEFLRQHGKRFMIADGMIEEAERR